MKILYFSSVSYGWMKQRPQFVAENLSKKYETDYLCLIPLGKTSEKQDKTPPFKADDIKVLPLALKSGFIRFLNKLFLKAKINFKKYDLVIVTHPIQLSYIPKNIPVVYECMDFMEGFYQGISRNTVAYLEKKLIKRAKAVIVSSDALKENLEKKGAEGKTTVIKNAVDKNWALTRSGGTKLKHPNLVYTGTISSWFDLETVADYCNKHKKTTVYMVGAGDYSSTNLPENIIFTGKVSHHQVREYIKEADILLMPFKNAELVKYVDPVKMYEYLSFNKHVVSSYWNELYQYKSNPYVHFYHSAEQFNSLCEIIPVEQGDINHKFIEKNCWESRMEEYFKIIKGM